MTTWEKFQDLTCDLRELVMGLQGYIDELKQEVEDKNDELLEKDAEIERLTALLEAELQFSRRQI